MSSQEQFGSTPPTLEDVRRAAEVLRGVARSTPLDAAHYTSGQLGRRVAYKLENLQETGSFKLRGAYVRLHLLSAAERQGGVVAASAGNHAQGVAWAARALGAACTIVMPRTCPLSKLEATRQLGAQVVLEGANFDDALERARRIEIEEGATFIPAFDDAAIIAGQGTVGLELLEQWPEVQTIVVPVGGGGLIAGVATAVKALAPSVRVIGVQAAAAPSMRAALNEGSPVQVKAAQTLADGLAVRRAGRLTFEAVHALVDDVLVVSEEEIAAAILSLLENENVVAEGAGAVGQAALLYHSTMIPGDRVAVVLSGGNIDVNILARIIEKGLRATGRLLRLRITLTDAPGELGRLAEWLGAAGANIMQIAHDRISQRLPLSMAEVEVTLETRGHNHVEEIIAGLQKEGWQGVQRED